MDKSLRGLQMISLALILIGIGVILHGLQVQAYESHPAIQVTHRYFDAIKNGNQPSLLNELSPNARVNWVLAHPQPLKPTPPFRMKVCNAEINEDRMIVTVELQEDRFKIRPRLRLQKQTNGDWKIDEILNIEPGVEFAREIERSRMAEREAIQSQLKARIVEKPGIEVLR